MHLMYVDESGDTGLQGSPTRYFVLSGLVLHELRWRHVLDELIAFRRELKQAYGLRLREEFHAAAFITCPGELVRIKRYDRLAMIRAFAGKLASLGDISIINILVDKANKQPGYDVFDMAWRALVQRFENTISWHHFPGPANPDERGFILCDHTDDKKLMLLLRQLHQYNPVPHQAAYGAGYRNLPLQYVIEDPSYRDSVHSFFLQAADLAAFLLYQRSAPSSYMRKKSGQNYFNRLKPVLCLAASNRDPEGIVRL
jgi:hypothetical protein